MINVKVRSRHVGKQLEEMSSKTRQACRLAISDTLKNLRFTAGKIIRSRLAIRKPKGSNSTPKKLIESRIQLVFAPKTVLNGRFKIKENTVPIRWFSPSKTKNVFANIRVKQGGSKIYFPKGFGPKVAKLRYSIFTRVGKERFPIQQVPGINISQLLYKLGAQRDLKALAKPALELNIKRRIERIAYIGRKKGQRSPAVIAASSGENTT